MEHAVATRHSTKGQLLGGTLVVRANAATNDIAHVPAVLDLTADEPFGGAKGRVVKKMRELDHPRVCGFYQPTNRAKPTADRTNG